MIEPTTVNSYTTDLRVGEQLAVSGPVTLTVEAKSGQLARLRFEHAGGVTFTRASRAGIYPASRQGLKVA